MQLKIQKDHWGQPWATKGKIKIVSIYVFSANISTTHLYECVYIYIYISYLLPIEFPSHDTMPSITIMFSKAQFKFSLNVIKIIYWYHSKEICTVLDQSIITVQID